MANEEPYTKPLPVLAGMTKEFYGWCAKGELRFQRCGGCKTWRHVPREMCAGCGAWEWTWERSSGRGRVFTWTVTAVPLHPAFKGATPYAPMVVEMDEGVRIVSELVHCPPDKIEIDMPVEVVFQAVTSNVTLPKFRRTQR